MECKEGLQGEKGATGASINRNIVGCKVLRYDEELQQADEVLIET